MKIKKVKIIIGWIILLPILIVTFPFWFVGECLYAALRSEEEELWN